MQSKINKEKQEEIEFQFKEYLSDAKYYNDLALIDLEAIFKAKINRNFPYQQECQESYLQNCNQQVIAMNNLYKLILSVWKWINIKI